MPTTRDSPTWITRERIAASVLGLVICELIAVHLFHSAIISTAMAAEIDSEQNTNMLCRMVKKLERAEKA
jgi:hypothetical protein